MNEIDSTGPMCVPESPTEDVNEADPRTPPSTNPATKAATDTVEPAPQCGPCPPPVDPKRGPVELCERLVDIPVARHLGLNHQWLRTPKVEAGMGPADGQADSPKPYLTKTAIVDHRGAGDQPDARCHVVPKEDAECVADELKLGEPLGAWSPTNQCQAFAAKVLQKCATEQK